MNAAERLREKLATEPSFTSDIEEAFNTVKSFGLKEFEVFKIRTFNDWLNHIDRMLTWRPSENEGGDYVYMNICLFYIILDYIPPTSEWSQDPVAPTTVPPYKKWLTDWIIEYAKEIGQFMDTPESLDREYLKTFYNAPRYHMQDYEPYPGTWTTFNEFFRRAIKREVRPIAAPDDPSIIVNPADCTYSGAWPVDDNGEVRFKNVPWSIEQLLDDVKGEYKDRFKGGVFTHSFLNTTDYHRQHVPVSGKVVQAKVIPGVCYLQVQIVIDPVTGKPVLKMHRKPHFAPKIHERVLRTLPANHPVHARLAREAEEGRSHLDAPNEPGYQFIQARGLVLIETEEFGLVAVMPIGMAQVSSVNLTIKEGDYVTKGQEMSYFKFGGSDIVMVFEKQANVTFTAKESQWNPFGKQIAIANYNKNSY